MHTLPPPASARARSGGGATFAGARGAADLHVLFLSASGQVGGAERVLLDLVAALVRRDPGLRLGVVMAADGPLAPAVAALGATAIVLPFPPALAQMGDFALGAGGRGGKGRFAARALLAVPAVLRYVVELRRVVREHAPRVLHSNGFKMHVLAALVRGRRRLVWHLHDFVLGRPVMLRLLRTLARRADLAVANSRAVAGEWQAVTGRPAVPVLNAVDLDRYSPDGARTDLDAIGAMAPAAPDVVRIGLVATLAAWKGHEVFLRALALLPRELPWRGYVVGGSVYQTRDSEASLEALHRLARELGIAERVAFCGFVSDTASAMRTLDVVVHASTKPEPFGLVIAEAMATARAVVVSAAGGAAELFTDGVDAVGFPPGDHAALAARLAPLVRDAAARERLGQAARASALARFAPERLAREMCEVYARLGVAAGAP